MRRDFILLISFFLLFSCTQRTSVPSAIIPLDSMRNIYRDIIEADQYSNEYLLKDSLNTKDSLSAKLRTLQLYLAVFQLHHISKDEFDKSLSFYASRPDLNKLIFDSLGTVMMKLRSNRKIIPPSFKKNKRHDTVIVAN